MPISRAQRKYPLALRPSNDYPLNAGIVTAYDFQGDPGNAYAKGDGVPHIGNNTYGKVPAGVFSLVEAVPGIFGRDPSVGRTTFGAYNSTAISRLGIGSADGKGNFTIHRRMRTPSVASTDGSSVTFCRHADGSAVKITLFFREYITEGNVVFYWSTHNGGSGQVTTPSVWGAESNRVPYNSIVDLHLVRDGDLIKTYVNGILVGTSSNIGLQTLNTDSTSTTNRNGITSGTVIDPLFIDETYWNRALTDTEVASHASDPYGGYTNNVVAPSGVVTNQPPPDGQNQRFIGTTANATSGTYSLVGTNTGMTIGPAPFAVVNDSFNFQASGLDPDTWTPTLTVTGFGGTAGVTGTSAFSIAGLGGGGDVSNEQPTGITVTGVTVNPATATGSRLFTASVTGANNPSQSVTWSATGGSINSGGQFTAPDATEEEQVVIVTATSSADPSKTGTARVTIAALVATVTGVVVSPSSASGSETFTAVVTGLHSPSQEVIWAASAGTITREGIFTPPAKTNAPQIITITATSEADPTKMGTATVTLAAAVSTDPTVTSVTVTPETATGSTTFAATVNGTNNPSQQVTWAASAGSISSSGVFTAPSPTNEQQIITVTATSVLNPSKSASVQVIVLAMNAPSPTITNVAVSPKTATGSRTFSVEVAGMNNPPQAVNWSTTAGSINSQGVFTAPAATNLLQVITVTATSVYDITKYDTAVVAIAPLVVVPPPDPVEPTVAMTVQVDLVDADLLPLASLTGLKWAWFDQARPDIFSAPVDKGAAGTTTSRGVFKVLLKNTKLKAGQVGWLEVTNSDGNPAAAYSAFSGPITLE